MVPDEPLFDMDEIMETCTAMEKANCDMFLFVIGSWMYTSLVTTAVNSLGGKPCVMYGLCDEIANGSLGVSVQLRYVMEEMKLPFVYMYGRIDDAERAADIKKALRAAWTKNDMAGRNIALIGGKCMMMYQTQVNEFNWKKVFGIDFPQYDHVEIFKELENIDEAEAERLARQFIDNCAKVNWKLENGEKINEDAILSQMRLYLAYKRFQELYDVDMFATKCMPELVNKCYGYSYGACLATALLNEEESTIAACEGDVPAGVSMYILKKLAHAPVMFADISRLNEQNGVMNFFNCGSGPVSMANSLGYRLWPIPPLVPDEAVAQALPERRFGRRVHRVRVRGRPHRHAAAPRRKRRHPALPRGRRQDQPAREQRRGGPQQQLRGRHPLAGLRHQARGPGLLPAQRHRAPLRDRLRRFLQGTGIHLRLLRRQAGHGPLTPSAPAGPISHRGGGRIGRVLKGVVPMQDRFYFGTNTKMFKTAAETVDYLRRLEELTHGIPPERAQRFVIPSYTSLGPARAELDRAGSGILLGAQNMGWEERGQYTGEISPLMLREAGARLVMVGHSERRHTFRETDAEEEKKVRCALDHGFRVLLCVGNSWRTGGTAPATRCCASS